LRVYIEQTAGHGALRGKGSRKRTGKPVRAGEVAGQTEEQG